jgi:hypothetical protein
LVKLFALGCLSGWALALPAFGSAVIIRALPTNIRDVPLSISSTDGAFGSKITVLYRTNASTLNEFLSGTLALSDEDERIAECSIQKEWTTNCVRFEFTIAPTRVAACRFTVTELAHTKDKTAMPGFTAYWFYLRDFLTNSPLPLAATNTNAPDIVNVVAPDVLKALPDWVRELKPGITADEVWERLHLAYYKHRLGGESTPEFDRWWLAWNYELDLAFEPPAKGSSETKSSSERDNRKLLRATLLKNGQEISASGK